jgi:hypothetical protein
MKYIFSVTLFFVSFLYGSDEEKPSQNILGSPVYYDYLDRFELFERSSRVLIDFDLPDEDGNMDLHHAVIAKDVKLVKKLCNYGANVLIKNKKGESPLSLAFWAIQDDYCDDTKTIHKVLRDTLKKR